MAIRKGTTKKGKEVWICDYYDAAGKRHMPQFSTKKAATEYESRKKNQKKGLIDGNITVADYAEEWIGKKARLANNTKASYKGSLTHHIIPALGRIKLENLTYTDVRDFLAVRLKTLKPTTVATINATLRAMLGEALREGRVLVNVAKEQGRELHLHNNRGIEVKAMTRDQLPVFLSGVEDEWYPFMLCLALSGVRLGEALALTVEDVNFETSSLLVNKSWDYRHEDLKCTKTGEERRIDLADELARVLREMLAKRREEYFAKGLPMPSLLFCDKHGERVMFMNASNAMKRGLKAAGLPSHFSLHCLRHTYASILLQNGESIQYVQKQLGHKSITTTVDRYGKWLPHSNKAAVDKLGAIAKGRGK